MPEAGRSSYYDERGSGRSPLDDPERVTTAGSLSDLEALLDGLALERPMLAGHSLAAHMVALFTATRPGRVRALVLANPGPPLLAELREPFGKEMASRRPPEDVKERIEAGGRLFRDFAAHDVAAKLTAISCPALVVHGELDPIPVESSRFIADALPRGELVVLPNANHYVSIEDPEVFAAAVEPFLAEHASG